MGEQESAELKKQEGSSQEDQQVLQGTRNHKDLLFCDIFSIKENALSLYNATNDTDYTDAEALEIYTLNSRTIIHTTMLLSDIDSRSSAACLSMLSSTVCVFRLRPHEVTSSHLPPPVGWCSSANRLHGAYS